MTHIETFATLAETERARRGAAYLGGGTLVMREVNAGVAPERLVRTTDPELARVQASGETLTLGAGVSMAQILGRAELAFLHPVARVIGGPQVRNMATIGGNLFAPHPYGDFAVALIALGARALLVGQGARPVEDLMRERAHPPLVSAVEIPRPRIGSFAFLKVSRVKPKGVSVLSIAALLPREGGRVRGARIAFGAMGPHPMRGAGAERALEGRTLDEDAIRRAADQAADGLDPPTDALASTWYRRAVAGVHLSRLLHSMGSSL